MTNKTRDSFRQTVFDRDKHRCVICGDRAKDAHHIIERRLFPDGGYHPDNGASLCGPCHLLAEQTVITVEDLRQAAGIKNKYLPPHLYQDQRYDKWGNIIVSEDRRLPGELFHDESVQKVLSSSLHLFDKLIKYPRTYHLPWSPGVNSDDRIIQDLSGVKGKEVIVTLKMDGENTLCIEMIYMQEVLALNLTPVEIGSETFGTK